MPTLLLGVLLASLASALFYTGLAVQALEARTVPTEHALRASLLTQLASRPKWIGGTALVVAGWIGQALALLFAPLTVVQPALAVGLVVLLAVASRFLHERVGRREIAAVGAIIAGVVGLTLTAPAHSVTQAEPLLLTLTLGALALAALSPFAFRGVGGLLPAIGAGLAYGWAGLSTKFASDALGSGRWVLLLVWIVATAAAAGVALVSEMSALQSRAAAQVGPVILVLDILVAVLLAPVLTGESWAGTPLGGLPIAVFVLLLLAGAVALARSPLVGSVTSPGESRSSSVTAERP